MDSTMYTNYTTTASGDSTGLVAMMMVLMPLYIAIIVVAIVAFWRVFTKAGKPGWAAIVPIYNAWTLAEIAGKPGWWGLAIALAPIVPLIGPVVSMVLALLISIEVAKKFGRSTVFGVVGLWLFSLIGYLILAFGKDTYQAASKGAMASGTDTPEVFAQNNPSATNQDPPTQPPVNPSSSL
jgi:hypothetical protein